MPHLFWNNLPSYQVEIENNWILYSIISQVVTESAKALKAAKRVFFEIEL